MRWRHQDSTHALRLERLEDAALGSGSSLKLPMINRPGRGHPSRRSLRIPLVCRLALTDTPPEDARRAIIDGLVAYNKTRTGIADHRPIAVLLHDEGGTVVGGPWGRTHGWLFVELLFVPEALRGEGLGASLLTQAETEARTRGCLDTFECQSRGFYERLGYSVLGEIRDDPPGFSRHYLQKRLAG